MLVSTQTFLESWRLQRSFLWWKSQLPTESLATPSILDLQRSWKFKLSENSWRLFTSFHLVCWVDVASLQLAVILPIIAIMTPWLTFGWSNQNCMYLNDIVQAINTAPAERNILLTHKKQLSNRLNKHTSLDKKHCWTTQE